MECPDGSFVGRDENNNCEFHPCPVGCKEDLFICPDGSSVARDPKNDCEFFPCPPSPPTGPTNPCGSCPADERCYMKDVKCIKAPCDRISLSVRMALPSQGIQRTTVNSSLALILAKEAVNSTRTVC
eukprot:TRINITY_DN139_c0_g1_i10.p1 TRINITY_DN139_c0_g1~~TRINITY_DN139_c0_g1_i10.p1  ORF type:complete len:127 (+),score=20.56 TRINITY_DN139_c0_g1_i10:187-567(+)